MDTTLQLSSDGQTERIDQCLKMYLCCAVQDIPNKWVHWLSLAELWYNSTYHTSLQCSPFKAPYGTDPHLGLLPPLHTTYNSDVVAAVKERQLALEQRKDNLARAQVRMKHYADANRSDRRFQVGSMVLLKLQPYAQSSVVNRPCHKLAYKFSGPYKVLERIGSTAYKLDLPPYSHIHPVFHVSQLKPFTPNSTPVFSDLPTSVALDTSCSEPSQILERRLVKKGDSAVVRVRVPWTRLPDSIATWEDFYNLKARFPAAAAIWGQPALFPSLMPLRTGHRRQRQTVKAPRWELTVTATLGWMKLKPDSKARPRIPLRT
jgi:hypothetical protein